MVYERLRRRFMKQPCLALVTTDDCSVRYRFRVDTFWKYFPRKSFPSFIGSEYGLVLVLKKFLPRGSIRARNTG